MFTLFMLGNQYRPVYGGGIIRNPALAAAGGGYMHPMWASALSQMGEQAGVGISGGIGSYFRGQCLPSAYPDSETGNSKDSDAGGSFHVYSTLTCNL